ncbi:MAG: hypothetical protein E6G59_05185 [Actinobacteria bacterium]|nr:MAG: hypothetical protein E6G59_05185 [Actinomycetota bacterium]
MAPDGTTAVGKIVEALRLRRTGEGWAGEMPADVWGQVVFGGFVIAHAVSAATRDAPEGRRLHSLHAYFLKPVVGRTAIEYRVRTLREGRTLASRLVDARQAGMPVLSMTCSFSRDVDGYEYQPPMPLGVPRPEDVAAESWGPWECAVIGPTAPDENGHYSSTHRMWFRTRASLPEDEHLATVFTAFATDLTWKGARPLHLDGDTRGIVSMDHAVWFHRPLRPDRWCYYDVTSVINAGGRGLVHGRMYSDDGLLCVSVAQETLLTPFGEAIPR